MKAWAQGGVGSKASRLNICSFWFGSEDISQLASRKQLIDPFGESLLSTADRSSVFH